MPFMSKISTSDRLSSNRSENSLLNLTKKFLKLIKSSSDKSININIAAAHLNVQKRRVYDIINVLEGLGLLGKWSVNCSRWIGGDIDNHIMSDSDNKENIKSEEVKDISREEKSLDKQIEKLNREINLLSQSEKNLENAYVTFSDLQSVPSLKNKMLFSIKAPSDTILEVPKYEKGTYRLNLSAESGNIMVYYVSDEPIN